MAFYQFKREQLVNTNIDELWDFVSSPRNLKKITPEYMGFDITSDNLNDKAYEGQIISYIVKPLMGIKTTWVTEITNVKDKQYFVDEQRIGPYTMWHHQHILIPQGDNKVLMKDIVSYVPPFGFIGAIANTLVIRKKLEEIFNHRFKVMEELYN